MPNNSIQINSTFVGVPITNIKVIGSGGVAFETSPLIGDAYDYYYYSNNLPKGLIISQPTQLKPYGLISGAFALPSEAGSFTICAQDAEGNIASYDITYEAIKPQLAFKHFDYFDYDELLIGIPLSTKNVSVGVYGGTGNNVFSIVNAQQDLWDNLTINAQGEISGTPIKECRAGTSFDVKVINKDSNENEIASAQITINCGPIYSKPRFERALCLVDNVNVAEVVSNNDSWFLSGENIPWPTKVGEALTTPIRLQVVGGVPFKDKNKYQFFALNFPGGLTVVYEEYTYDDITYNCAIKGRCTDAYNELSTLQVIAKDGKNEIAVINLGFNHEHPYTVYNQLSFQASSEIKFDSGYEGAEDLSSSAILSLNDLKAIISGDPSITIVDEYNQPIDDNYGLTQTIFVHIEYKNSTLYFTDIGGKAKYTTKTELLNFSNLNIDGEYDDEDSLLQLDVPGGNSALIITKDFQANNEAIPAGEPHNLKIKIETDDNQVVYYPFQDSKTYNKLEWKIGRTYNDNTWSDLTNIYIDSNELNFTTEQAQKGKNVKIFLIKHELLDQDPIAKKVLQQNGETVKSFQEGFQSGNNFNDETILNNNFYISDYQFGIWKAWAEKQGQAFFNQYGIGQSEIDGAKASKLNLKKYLRNRYRRAGYIVGGKPPYTISVQDSLGKMLTSSQIANFEVVQRENGRDLNPEEIYLYSRMNLASSTPTKAKIVLSDSLGQKVEYPFGEAIRPTAPDYIVFINSLEDIDIEVINGWTTFKNFPFLQTNIENLQVSFKKQIGLTIERASQNNVFYFYLNGTINLSNLSEEDKASLLNAQDLYGNFRQFLNIKKDSAILSEDAIKKITTGSFNITNVINLNDFEYPSGATFSVAASYWGNSFPGITKTIKENNIERTEIVSNPFFQSPLNNWSFRIYRVGDNKDVNAANDWLTNLGLAVDSDTGLVSGNFKSTRKDQVEKTKAYFSARYFKVSQIPPISITVNKISSTIINAQITKTKTILFYGISGKMEYNIKDPVLGIPRVVLRTNTGDAKPQSELESWEKDLRYYEKDGKQVSRITGGIGPYTFTIEKNASILTPYNTYLNLFKITKNKPNKLKLIPVKNGDDSWYALYYFKQQDIPPTDITIKITDKVGHSLIAKIPFNGTGDPLTNLETTNRFTSKSYFRVGSNMVGDNVKQFEIRENNVNGTTAVASSTSTGPYIDVLKYLKGGCFGSNPTDQIREQVRTNKFLQYAGKRLDNIASGEDPYYKTSANFKYGGTAYHVKLESPTSTQMQSEFQITVTDLMLRNENLYSGGALNDTQTFNFELMPISPKIEWTTELLSIPYPKANNWKKVDSINLMDFIETAEEYKDFINFDFVNSVGQEIVAGNYSGIVHSVSGKKQIYWGNESNNTKNGIIKIEDKKLKWDRTQASSESGDLTALQFAIKATCAKIQQGHAVSKTINVEIGIRPLAFVNILPNNAVQGATVTKTNNRLTITFNSLTNFEKKKILINQFIQSGTGRKPYEIVPDDNQCTWLKQKNEDGKFYNNGQLFMESNGDNYYIVINAPIAVLDKTKRTAAEQAKWSIDFKIVDSGSNSDGSAASVACTIAVKQIIPRFAIKKLQALGDTELHINAQNGMSKNIFVHPFLLKYPTQFGESGLNISHTVINDKKTFPTWDFFNYSSRNQSAITCWMTVPNQYKDIIKEIQVRCEDPSNEYRPRDKTIAGGKTFYNLTKEMPENFTWKQIFDFDKSKLSELKITPYITFHYLQGFIETGIEDFYPDENKVRLKDSSTIDLYRYFNYDKLDIPIFNPIILDGSLITNDFYRIPIDHDINSAYTIVKEGTEGMPMADTSISKDWLLEKSGNIITYNNTSLPELPVNLGNLKDCFHPTISTNLKNKRLKFYMSNPIGWNKYVSLYDPIEDKSYGLWEDIDNPIGELKLGNPSNLNNLSHTITMSSGNNNDWPNIYLTKYPTKDLLSTFCKVEIRDVDDGNKLLVDTYLWVSRVDNKIYFVKPPSN